MSRSSFAPGKGMTPQRTPYDRSSTSSTRKSSMTPLASSRSHMACVRSRPAAGATSRSVSSTRRPTRTSLTSPNPRVCNACCTAFPWGSRMPRFGVMYTRARRFPIASCGEAADATGRLLIRVLDAAEVAAEAILVELLPAGLVPEATGVGTYLVRDQDLAVMAPELEFHVDQDDPAGIEELAHERVDLQCAFVDLGQLRGRGELQVADVPVVDHRIVEGVVLVEVLDDRLGHALALGAAETLGEASGDDVPHHHLDLDDLAGPDEHLALREAADEVGRDTVLL